MQIAQMDHRVSDVVEFYGALWVHEHVAVTDHNPSGRPTLWTRSRCIAVNEVNYHGWRVGLTMWNFQGNELVGHYNGTRPAAAYQAGVL